MANSNLYNGSTVSSDNDSNYHIGQRHDTLSPAGSLPMIPPGFSNAGTGMEVPAFSNRFAQLKNLENDKNGLIEDLIRNYDELLRKFAEASSDLEREKGFNRDSQHKSKLKDELLKKYEYMLGRAPFVVCLLDGDGMLFRDELLQKGEAGGREAAEILSKSIRAQCSSLNIPNEVRVVTRMYANISDLASVYYQARILENRSDLMEFMSGFVKSKSLFDVVDVRWGKDRADTKLIETFKLYLDDCHCRHIFFGGSHDNGYARFLENVDAEPSTKVTLLEGSAFARELKDLPFKKSKFGDLFREELINLKKVGPAVLSAPSSALPPLRSSVSNDIIERSQDASEFESHNANGLSSRPKTTNPSTQIQTESPHSSPPAKAAVVAEGGWAVAARKMPPNNRVNSAPDNKLIKTTRKTILKNKNGQRLDPPGINCSAQVYNEVKSWKLCNSLYLRGFCTHERDRNSAVSLHHHKNHEHEQVISQYERNVLAKVARSLPCNYGSDCEDPDCILGHHCPNPIDEYSKSSKNCIHGDHCWFEPAMHIKDREPRKTVKV